MDGRLRNQEQCSIALLRAPLWSVAARNGIVSNELRAQMRSRRRLRRLTFPSFARYRLKLSIASLCILRNFDQVTVRIAHITPGLVSMIVERVVDGSVKNCAPFAFHCR